MCITVHQKVGKVVRDCVTQGFLLGYRATEGKTDTPSWCITAGDIRRCALYELPYPAMEAPSCLLEVLTGSR